LTLSSKDEKDVVKKKNGMKWLRNERSSTFMEQHLSLPDTADVANVSAAYQHVILTVTMPKKEAA
jgi:HSP20 family molecular chaperone IbpA